MDDGILVAVHFGLLESGSAQVACKCAKKMDAAGFFRRSWQGAFPIPRFSKWESLPQASAKVEADQLIMVVPAHAILAEGMGTATYQARQQ